MSDDVDWEELCEECGECCGITEIDKGVFKNNKDKIQREIEEVIDLGRKVAPITESIKCVFLTEKKKCAIYRHRPQVCRLYGSEKDIMLTCPYYDKNGNERSKEERERLRKKINDNVDSQLEKIKRKRVAIE